MMENIAPTKIMFPKSKSHALHKVNVVAREARRIDSSLSFAFLYRAEAIALQSKRKMAPACGSNLTSKRVGKMLITQPETNQSKRIKTYALQTSN
nr:hypothetical protein [Tanacetum cinerariifolium]